MVEVALITTCKRVQDGGNWDVGKVWEEGANGKLELQVGLCACGRGAKTNRIFVSVGWGIIDRWVPDLGLTQGWLWVLDSRRL